jgi:adenylate kinase
MGLFIIMMGVQGAGKGVQAQFIRETYQIPHVSTGDLFRAMKIRTDDFARRIQEIMAAGQLIDDDTTNQMVAERLAEPDARHGVILDGYPRNPVQADFLENYLRGRGESLTAVLLMELDLYVAFKRAFGRVQTASKPPKTYNIYYQNEGLEIRFIEHPNGEYPPRIEAVLKATGEKLLRRPDDANAAAIIKRIDLYLEETQPLVDYYEAKGLLHRINADQPVEAVSADIRWTIERAQV